MAHNNIEIEIKVRVENTENIRIFLEKHAEYQAEHHQLDEYYNPPNRDFLAVRPVTEWLRLRDTDGVCSVNYKDWHYDENGRGKYCDELETKIDSLETMRSIFEKLNYKLLGVVDKVRKTWHYDKYEIAIDNVRGLGTFVEIEYIGTDAPDPEKTNHEMVNFLKNIGCGTIELNHQGYPFLVLFPDEVRYETV